MIQMIEVGVVYQAGRSSQEAEISVWIVYCFRQECLCRVDQNQLHLQDNANSNDLTCWIIKLKMTLDLNIVTVFELMINQYTLPYIFV